MIGDIIAGLGIALLSGMGVGSAGLLVVWLTMADTVPQLAAQGLNLYFFSVLVGGVAVRAFASAQNLLRTVRADDTDRRRRGAARQLSLVCA